MLLRTKVPFSDAEKAKPASSAAREQCIYPQKS